MCNSLPHMLGGEKGPMAAPRTNFWHNPSGSRRDVAAADWDSLSGHALCLLKAMSITVPSELEAFVPHSLQLHHVVAVSSYLQLHILVKHFGSGKMNGQHQ